MKTQNQIAVILINLILILTVLVTIFLSPIGPNHNIQETYNKCCDGNMCSDTYYLEEDGLCHLSLCEGYLFKSFQNKCTYLPK